MEALKLGFTSVMYDCSTVSYEENVERVAEMVRICHAMGVTVEAELGHVGDNAGAGKLENPEDYYTDPDTALDYITRTGADSLAVAVGNAPVSYTHLDVYKRQEKDRCNVRKEKLWQKY